MIEAIAVPEEHYDLYSGLEDPYGICSAHRIENQMDGIRICVLKQSLSQNTYGLCHMFILIEIALTTKALPFHTSFYKCFSLGADTNVVGKFKI